MCSLALSLSFLMDTIFSCVRCNFVYILYSG